MSFAITRPAVPCAGCRKRSRPKRSDPVRRVAGKSTLNRLEARAEARGREVSQDRLRCAEAWNALFVDIFLDGHKRAPKEIVLDLDATDDTIHGEHRRSVLHMATTTAITDLPLYIGSAAGSKLGAKLHPANIDGAAGRGRRGRPDRRPHPGPLAEGADRAEAAIRASAARI